MRLFKNDHQKLVPHSFISNASSVIPASDFQSFATGAVLNPSVRVSMELNNKKTFTNLNVLTEEADRLSSESMSDKTEKQNTHCSYSMPEDIDGE